MFHDGTSIHIEEDDQCFTCEYFLKGVSCPLLEALATGVVYLEEEITVTNCSFYRRFERRLSLVEIQPKKSPKKKPKKEKRSPNVSASKSDEEEA